MTLADILTAIVVALLLALAYLIGRRICERVRAARWRRIREPAHGVMTGTDEDCGDQGGMPSKAYRDWVESGERAEFFRASRSARADRPQDF